MNYKAEGDSDRTRTGIAAVFGNVDSGGDITHPGAFTKTLREGRQRYKHLWNHNAGRPPIASIKEIKEVGRDQLPDEILAWAPDATGGLWVKREYYNVPEADWVLEAIDKGDVNEMSYAYDIVRADESEVDGMTVRNLRELILFDTSDVNYGMNAATVGAGAKGLFTLLPIGLLAQHLQIHEAEVKAGRRNAAADMELIKGIHGMTLALGYNACAPMDEDEPKSDEPEPLQPNTSLDLLKLKTQGLALGAATLQL